MGQGEGSEWKGKMLTDKSDVGSSNLHHMTEGDRTASHELTAQCTSWLAHFHACMCVHV